MLSAISRINADDGNGGFEVDGAGAGGWLASLSRGSGAKAVSALAPLLAFLYETLRDHVLATAATLEVGTFGNHLYSIYCIDIF